MLQTLEKVRFLALQSRWPIVVYTNAVEGGRDWRDKNIRWMPEEHKGKDGYTSVASRMLAQLGLEENEELS